MKEFLIRAITIREDIEKMVSSIYDHFDMHTAPLHFKQTDRRSLSANAQVWVWAKQVGESTGEDTKTVYARMKRDHGLPIRLADPEYGAVTDWMLKKLKFNQLDDRRQLIVIDSMEITRNFSTKQHGSFRDSVQAFYNAHGFNLQYLEKQEQEQ